KEQWDAYSKAEDAKFDKAHPEYSDAAARMKAANGVVKMLEAEGVSREDIQKSFNGQMNFNLRSAAVQSILIDAMKFREAKANIARPDPKPAPPVQKPGTGVQGFSTSQDEAVAAASRRLTQRGGALKDYVALRNARDRARG